MSFINKLLSNPLVPVFYHADVAFAKNVVKACYDGGVRIFEFTNRGENAPEVFKELVAFVKAECPGMILGIGTIMNADSAQEYIDLGADFVVQPCTVKEVGDVCIKNNISWIPGVLSPTEINQALVWGAASVKIFPGNVVGSSYVKALRGPMPNVKIMVTGGVEPTHESISEWLSAGANAVGLGSQLFKNADEPEKITLTLSNLYKSLNIQPQ